MAARAPQLQPEVQQAFGGDTNAPNLLHFDAAGIYALGAVLLWAGLLYSCSHCAGRRKHPQSEHELLQTHDPDEWREDDAPPTGDMAQIVSTVTSAGASHERKWNPASSNNDACVMILMSPHDHQGGEK